MERSPARHIAIIMDGNGRWAERRSHARVFGHIRGAKRVREITTECARLGVEALTLYTFSTENWQRPQLEVDVLMRLLRRYLRDERDTILENNIRFQTIGCPERIPPEVRKEVERMVADSAKNTGMTMTLALSYGSRQEIANAARGIARDALAGKLDPGAVDEKVFGSYLFTRGLPEPDLLIRTGGDKRISNYLLWQLAYAELFFTETPWPEFGVADLRKALGEFGERERRYGLTSRQVREQNADVNR